MKKIKVHSLTGRITPKLMRQAFQAVKRNRGAAGVDKVSIKMFEANLEENLDGADAGSEGPERSGLVPLRRVHIPKGPGSTKLRPLGIPVVRDRVAQEVVRRLLAPIFEPQFHDDSSDSSKDATATRRSSGSWNSTAKGTELCSTRTLQGFFDNIPHPIIMEAVAAEVADGNILRSGRRISHCRGDGRWSLQADYNRHTTRRRHFAVTGEYRAESPGLAAPRSRLPLRAVCRRLRRRLPGPNGRRKRRWNWYDVCSRPNWGSHLSPEKTKITTYGKGYEFLGFSLSSRSRRMRDKSVQKFKAKVRELTVRKHNLDREAIEKLNRVIRGTANYFATELFDLSLDVPETRFVDTHAASLHEVEAEELQRQSASSGVGYFRRKLGLLTLEEFCTYRDRHGKARRVIPRHGATSVGVAR